MILSWYFDVLTNAAFVFFSKTFHIFCKTFFYYFTFISYELILSNFFISWLWIHFKISFISTIFYNKKMLCKLKSKVNQKVGVNMNFFLKFICYWFVFLYIWPHDNHFCFLYYSLFTLMMMTLHYTIDHVLLHKSYSLMFDGISLIFHGVRKGNTTEII